MSYLYTLHPHERQRVDGYFIPGMDARRLGERDDFGSWKIIRQTATIAVLQHYNRAMMYVVLKDGRALSYELFEAEAAREKEASEKRLGDVARR